jgi:hypothetical protein
MTILRPLLLGAGLGLLSFACHDTCPTGYVLSQNACVLEAHEVFNTPDSGDAGPTIDAGNPDSGATPACTDSTFGKVCLTSENCGCDTGTCTGINGAQGFCTHLGCLQDASVCPAGWSCMDASVYQAGVSLCIPP